VPRNWCSLAPAASPTRGAEEAASSLPRETEFVETLFVLSGRAAP